MIEKTDTFSLSMECGYKRTFQSAFIQKGDDTLENSKTEIREWVAECDTHIIVGQFVPVPADFFA